MVIYNDYYFFKKSRNIAVHTLLINVQNFKCHIFMKCHTTTDSLVHCVFRHQCLIVFFHKHLKGLVCSPGCLIPWVQALGASSVDWVVGWGC